MTSTSMLDPRSAASKAWIDAPARRLEDFPDQTLRLVMDYAVAAGSLTAGRNDFRIPSIVADGWLKRGYCVFSVREFASRYSTTRRTVAKSLKRLAEAGAIREIGRTADKRPVLVPNLELGADWRAAREAHDGR